MTIYAHTWEDLGEQRIRRWINDLEKSEQVNLQINDPRPVRVEILSWKDQCVGAKHYTLNIKEEDNQWWSEKENAWMDITIDSRKRGFSLSADCYSREEAIELAKFTVDLIFGKENTDKRKMWKINWGKVKHEK